MKRTGWIACFVIGLGLLSLWFLVLGARAAFPHVPTRLSDPSNVCDFEPRADISEEGDWLATVWIKGMQQNGGCKSQGTPVIRWATELSSTLQTWSPMINLSIPSGACAVHADVAVTGAAAQVAVTTWQPCNDSAATSAILFYTCDLNSGYCTSGQTAVRETDTANWRLFEARLDVDAQNYPHLVYVRAHHNLSAGQVWYARRLASTWQIIQKLSLNTQEAYRPVIAVTNGTAPRAHFAWEFHTDYTDDNGNKRGNGSVHYTYCATTGSCAAIGQQMIFESPYPRISQFVEGTYPIPALAARGDQIFLVWNVCSDFNENQPCNQYLMLYTRSIQNDEYGVSFITPREVSTEQTVSGAYQHYPGTDGVNNEYEKYLRPSVQLNTEGLPYLAWQMKNLEGGYTISTTYAISLTETGDLLWDHDTWQVGAGDDYRVLPTLLTVDPSIDSKGIHILYMRTWEESSPYGNFARSQIYYDYFGDNRLEGISFAGQSRTNELPDERGQTYQIRAVNGQGQGIAGVPIAFETDFGSFNYTGTGEQIASAPTDIEGWARITLYTNVTGTAAIRAWVDYNNDQSFDSDEPFDVFEQTWVNNTTPSISVASGAVMANYLITATIRDHPYLSGQDYALWWCPTNGNPVYSRLKPPTPFMVEVETWDSENAIFRVPWNVSGTYHLETHVDYDAPNSCGDPNTLIASSPLISATTTLPSGPIILLGMDTPDPGTTITATLLQHSALENQYALWWCTVEGISANQRLADGITVDSTGKKENISIQIPATAQGIYQIESHTGTEGCGDTESRRAIRFVNTGTRVFLPIVLRVFRR